MMRKIIYLLSLLMIYFYAPDVGFSKHHQAILSSRNFIEIVKRDDSMTPISINTTIKPVYQNRDTIIAFYDNVNPDNRHGQTRLLIFDGDHYMYSYNADSDNCLLKGSILRCASGFSEKPSYDVKIADILARRNILIGGYIAEAYETDASRRFRSKRP